MGGGTTGGGEGGRQAKMQPLVKAIPMAPGQAQGWMWTNTSPHIVEFLLP